MNAQPPPQQRCFPALDGLRGFAVLVVFASHAANEGLLPGWLGMGFGQMGVQLFFVLSGFLMVHLYGGQRMDQTAVQQFLCARAARILPLYGLVLGFSILMAILGVGFRYQFTSVAEFLRAALLIRAPQELWSIPVEAQFYGLFLVLWGMIVRFPERGIGLLATGFVVAMIFAGFWRGWVSEAEIVLPYLHAFLGGGLVAMLLASGRLERLLPRLAHPHVLPMVLLLFLLNMPGLRSAALMPGFYPNLWLDPLRLAATGLLFLTALAGRSTLFCQPPLMRLGQVSFAVYLFHRPLMQMLGPHLPTPVAALVILVVTLGLALISMRLIEGPIALIIRTAGGARRHQSLPQAAG